jgi:hypothetical protein
MPPERPEFFVDRSLGYYLVPGAIEQLGFTAHTMRSVFGLGAEERVPDTTWLVAAGEHGWIVLTKDGRIRHRPDELAVIEWYRLRVFILASARLTGLQQVERVRAHIHRMVNRARRPGPWIDGLYRDRVARLWPR